jgi:peptidoglycan/LPS O-acetylase OafA/YrhL
MKAEGTGFSEGLASLRGLAAAFVVVFHALLIFEVAGFDNPHRLPIDVEQTWLTLTHVLLSTFNGSAAVILFFVLSATVLTLSLDRADRFAAPEILAFYVRRGFRLFPLLVAVTLVAAVMHHLYFTADRLAVATSWMNRYYRHDPGFEEILKNALGWSNSLNSPAWTIWIEIAASAAFPALYRLATRGPATAAAAGVLLVSLMFVDLPGLRNVETYLFPFFLGCLVPRYGAAPAAAFGRLPAALRTGTVLTVLALALWFERLYSPAVFKDPSTVLVMTLCAGFLVTVVFFGSRSVLRWRGFLFLGEISYSLYLIHFTVLFAVAHAVGFSLMRPPSPGEALALNLLLAVMTLALTLPIAVVTYHTIERPFMRLGHRLSNLILKGRPLGRPLPVGAP